MASRPPRRRPGPRAVLTGVRPEPGEARGRARRTRGPASRVATAIPPATSSAEAARRQPIGSPMTSAVASTPKSGVVRLNAASAAGPVRLEQRHVRDEVEPRDHDTLVEERGARAARSGPWARTRAPTTGGGTAGVPMTTWARSGFTGWMRWSCRLRTTWRSARRTALTERTDVAGEDRRAGLRPAPGAGRRRARGSRRSRARRRRAWRPSAGRPGTRKWASRTM